MRIPPSRITHRALALALLTTTHAESFAELAERVGPAVVHISMVEGPARVPQDPRDTLLGRPPRKHPAHPGAEAPQTMGQGSSFIVDPPAMPRRSR